MIDHNHPAVEALEREGFAHDGGTMHAWRCERPDDWPGYCTCPEETVAIVRDNLTADDLRHTPAGRALMRAGWVAAWQTISNDPDRIYDEPDDAFNAQFDALEGETND